MNPISFPFEVLDQARADVDRLLQEADTAVEEMEESGLDVALANDLTDFVMDPLSELVGYVPWVGDILELGLERIDARLDEDTTRFLENLYPGHREKVWREDMPLDEIAPHHTMSVLSERRR